VVALITQQYPQAALPIVLGTFFIFALRLSTKSTFKKDFASRFETTVVASDAQIEFSNAKGNAVFNWMAIVRYAESKQLFLLYTQSNVFNVIPKRAFTPEDATSLREILRRHASADSPRDPWLVPKVVLFVVIVASAVILMVFAIYRIRSTQ
jgi:hypothetical protein